MPTLSPVSPAIPTRSTGFAACSRVSAGFQTDASYPYGAGGPNAGFALITDAYMRRYAPRAKTLAASASPTTERAVIPASIDEISSNHGTIFVGRPIADPLVLFDCVMPCAGAETFLVMRDETARSLGVPSARVLATIERTTHFPKTRSSCAAAGRSTPAELFAMAGVAPSGIDVVQTYDDYP